MIQNHSNRNHQPLNFAADRSALIRRATERPDGPLSVGGLAYGTSPRRRGGETLRALGRLVELLRRQKQRSPEQLAAAAAVELADVLAIEQGRPVSGAQVIERLAGVFGIDPRPLLQLAGFGRGNDEELSRLATVFAARLESNKPLGAEEEEVLSWFRAQVLASGQKQAD